MMSPRPLPVPAFPRENISPSSSTDASEYKAQGAHPPLQRPQPHIYTTTPVNPLKRTAETESAAIQVSTNRSGTAAPRNDSSNSITNSCFPPSYPSNPQSNQSAHYTPHASRPVAAYSRNTLPSPSNTLATHRPSEFRRSSQHMDHQGRTLSSPPLSQVDTHSADTSPDRSRSVYSTAMMPSPASTIPRGSEGPQEDHILSQSYSGPPDDVYSFMRSSTNQSNPPNYSLIVRQQPHAARACGFGERDRRVIDPPPIVQLMVTDPVTGAPDANTMRYMFHVVHCTLWSEDGNEDETALTGADKRMTRRLMGTLVSSPFVGHDENGDEGCFFCFPDLSCRTHGRYRLRFVLIRLGAADLQPDGYTPIITEILSDVFTVFTAKEFPGMRASTSLTKALKRQGCAISVKKGNDKGAGTGAVEGRDEDDEADSSKSVSSRAKRRRKS